MHNAQSTQRSTFGADRLKKTETRTFNQPPKWSHQKELERLKGKPIYLFTGEGPIKGTLLDADQFTLRVRVESLGEGLDDVILTFFKSALVGYGAR